MAEQPRCHCGALMRPAGIGAYPYDCFSSEAYPDHMVYQGCYGTPAHDGWTHAEPSRKGGYRWAYSSG